MKTICETYRKLKGDNRYLKIELYYVLGGVNCFTYKQEPRGFYLSVHPVTRTRNFVSFEAFTGAKVCVHECKRFSKKDSEQARIKAENYQQKLIDYVLSKQGLELEETGEA